MAGVTLGWPRRFNLESKMKNLIFWAAVLPLLIFLSACTEGRQTNPADPGSNPEVQVEPVFITELSAHYLEIYEETTIVLPTLAGLNAVDCLPSVQETCGSASYLINDVEEGYEVSFTWWPESYPGHYVRIWYLK